VVTGLFWKPFDERFKDILKQFNFHTQLVKDELQLATYQEAGKGWQHNAEEQKKEAEEAAKAREAAEHTRTMTDEMREMNETRYKGWLLQTQQLHF
jgi:hypothetical protein